MSGGVGDQVGELQVEEPEVPAAEIRGPRHARRRSPAVLHGKAKLERSLESKRKILRAVSSVG